MNHPAADNVLAILDDAFASIESVPAHLSAAAESAFGMIDVDAVLAELLFDSADEPVGVRSDTSGRRSFRFGALDSVIRVQLNSTSLMLILEPPLSVECRVVTQQRSESIRTDDLGELAAELNGLPVRIELDLPSGAVRTPWIIG